MIPSCLKLTSEQLEVFEEWAKEFPPSEDEEDCCMTSRFTFTCIASGIGDTIIASCRGREIHLEYDDDGKIIGEIDNDNGEHDFKAAI